MKIAIASGKGGTGKTTVSCALAFAVDGPVALLDCGEDTSDVGHGRYLFTEDQRRGSAMLARLALWTSPALST